MVLNQGEFVDINTRLDTLEKELCRAVRRSRIAVAFGVCCFALTCGAWTLGSQQSRAKEIRASLFVVEDEEGRTRALLGVGDRPGDQPALTLADENGKPRVKVSIADAGSGLIATDEEGKNRAGLLSTKVGPMAVLGSRDEHNISLLVAADGPEVRMSAKGGASAELLVGDEVQALALKKKEQVRTMLGVTRESCGLLVLDERGILRVSAGGPASRPAMAVLDEKGEMVWTTSPAK